MLGPGSRTLQTNVSSLAKPQRTVHELVWLLMSMVNMAIVPEPGPRVHGESV